MLKALTGLLLALAAAFAISSPAAAAPVCNDDEVVVYGNFWPGFVAHSGDTSQFCDGLYDIVSIDWSLGSSYVWFQDYNMYLDGVYSTPETAVITVTDGVDTDTFTLVVKPCFIDPNSPGAPCYL